MYQNEVPQDYLMWSSLAETRRLELLDEVETVQFVEHPAAERPGWAARQVGHTLRQLGTLLVEAAEQLEGGEVQPAAS